MNDQFVSAGSSGTVPLLLIFQVKSCTVQNDNSKLSQEHCFISAPITFSYQNLLSDMLCFYAHHMHNDTATLSLVSFPKITAFCFNFSTVLGVAG